MPFFKKNLAGPGYIILNALRVLNIVSLLLVVTGSIVMLVKTFVVSKFFFFDAMSHVITAILGLFLAFSEFGLFRGYFARNMPLLGPSHGFVFLGILMIIMGMFTLGNLNKKATSEESLGTSFWQIVISSGILVAILGVFNIIANYVFRVKSLNLSARMVRALGAAAPQGAVDTMPIVPSPMSHPAMSQPASSNYSHSVRSNSVRTVGTMPSYYAPKSEMSGTTRFHGYSISTPIDHNPAQFAKFKGSEDITRPDPAAHPALGGGRF